jgi:hypothetical protein
MSDWKYSHYEKGELLYVCVCVWLTYVAIKLAVDGTKSKTNRNIAVIKAILSALNMERKAMREWGWIIHFSHYNKPFSTVVHSFASVVAEAAGCFG